MGLPGDGTCRQARRTLQDEDVFSSYLRRRRGSGLVMIALAAAAPPPPILNANVDAPTPSPPVVASAAPRPCSVFGHSRVRGPAPPEVIGFRGGVAVRVFPRVVAAELTVHEIVKVGPLHELRAALLRELLTPFGEPSTRGNPSPRPRREATVTRTDRGRETPMPDLCASSKRTSTMGLPRTRPSASRIGRTRALGVRRWCRTGAPGRNSRLVRERAARALLGAPAARVRSVGARMGSV